MAKKKYSKDERKAIISKLERIAREREEESRKKLRDSYVPSERYLRLETLLKQMNEINGELQESYRNQFYGWRYEIVNIQYHLNNIREEEINPFVTKYRVNKDDLEVEIILADQENPVDDLIESLLAKCVIK